MEFVLSNDCCRICLRKDDNIHKISIFSEFKEGFSIASIVELLFSVHIVVTDKLDQICEKCLRGVESVHQIYCKVQENNVKYNLLCSAEYDKVDILLEEDSNQAVIETVDNFLAVQVKEEPQDEFLLEEDVSQTKRRSTRTLKKDTKKDVGSKKATKKGKRGKRRLTKQKTVESNKKQKLLPPETIEIQIKTEEPDLELDSVINDSHEKEWYFLKSMLEDNLLQTENDPIVIQQKENEVLQDIDAVQQTLDQVQLTGDNIFMIENAEIDHVEDIEMETTSIGKESKSGVNSESEEEWKPKYKVIDKPYDPSHPHRSKPKKRKRRIRFENKRKRRKVACPICGKLYTGIGSHMFSHDKEGILRKFECDICGKRFFEKHCIQKHMLSHLAEQPLLLCPYEGCDKRFKSDQGLKHHKQVTHIGTFPFKCEMCDKRFSNKSCLRSHEKVHMGGSLSNKCIYCTEVFNRQPELITHIESVHADKNHTFYNCGECDSKLVSLKKLKSHVKNVHAKKLLCTICGQKFHNKLALDTHSYKHLNEKPDHLKCPDCGKEFSSIIALNRHSLKHTNTILHNCGICGKGYTRLDSYKVHMKSHAS